MCGEGREENRNMHAVIMQCLLGAMIVARPLAPMRVTRAHLQMAAPADDEQVDVEVFEFADGGMDVASLLAALGGDDGRALDIFGDEGRTLDLESIGSFRTTVSSKESSLALENDEWELPPSPLLVSEGRGRVSPDAAAIKAVHEVGVVRTRAVSRTTAEALRADVLEQLELARATTSTHGLGLTDSYLSSVLAPDNGSEQVRWDVRLALTPAVRMALREMLAVEAGSLTSIFEALAGGGDAELWECAAIVSAPGATAQPVHSDTEYSPSPCLFTAFVALQPVTADNGPTRFLPRTHTAEAHAPRSAADERTFLTSAASSVALLETGECALYDGRLLHCGTAHQGDELRVLFYVTFRHVNADSSLANEAAHSIRDEYKGALRLRDFSASGGELSDCTRKLYTS